MTDQEHQEAQRTATFDGARKTLMLWNTRFERVEFFCTTTNEARDLIAFYGIPQKLEIH